MAALIWTEPALADLDAIADYIAIDDPDAARALVRRIFAHVEQLVSQPESGSRPRELGRNSYYRQVVEPPCRIFYRHHSKSGQVVIVHVMRGEQRLRLGRLARRN